MSKYKDIKVRPSTYKQLAQCGRYGDSMDIIIQKLLKESRATGIQRRKQQSKAQEALHDT
jgi:hypothetical protein